MVFGRKRNRVAPDKSRSGEILTECAKEIYENQGTLPYHFETSVKKLSNEENGDDNAAELCRMAVPFKIKLRIRYLDIF